MSGFIDLPDYPWEHPSEADYEEARKAMTPNSYEELEARLRAHKDVDDTEIANALADLRKQRDEAESWSHLRAEDIMALGQQLGVAETELATLRAENERLTRERDEARAERLKLDKRIRNQRLALRQNWEIVDMRAGHTRNKEVRSKYLGYWSKTAAKLRAAEAEAERLRKVAEGERKRCADIIRDMRQYDDCGASFVIDKALDSIALLPPPALTPDLSSKED